MKIYRLLLVFFAVVGLSLMAISAFKKPTEDQAGMAYTELEDGSLELNIGQRTNGRVVPSGKPPGADEEWLTKFELTERSGEQRGSENLRGQPYVAGFFFSTCPSICVRQNSKVQELQTKFAGQPVRFVSISCDPEVDRPEVLAKYAERFDADPEQWYFLTGDMKYIRRIGSEKFGLAVERMGHPEKFALVDAEGEVYGLYAWSDALQWETLGKDIERMIAAGGVLDDAATDENPDL